MNSPTPSPVLVTGGTGRLGRLVVPRVRDAGYDVRVLTRQHDRGSDGIEYVVGDLTTGQGVDSALVGIGTVVHCASSTKGDAEATRNLVLATSIAGTQHLVYVSIVGIERISSWSYPKAKLECERIVAGSGVPWTILRATQFYDYVLGAIRQLCRLPVVPVPSGFHVRPIDPDEVAARLVELVTAGPAGHVPDIAGPEVSDWTGLLRGYLHATRRRRLVVPVRIPGTHAVRTGGLLPSAAHTTGHRTWEQFLATSVADQRPPGTVAAAR